MAKKIVLNAKMRRTSICGAAETLLIDEKCIISHTVPKLLKPLFHLGVKLLLIKK